MKAKRRKTEPFSVEVEAIANVHWHGREIGPVMQALIREAIAGGADVLGFQPNTEIPLTTRRSVIDYRDNAMKLSRKVSRASMKFIPFVMLTEETRLEELVDCHLFGIDDGKIYPDLRTTKSEHGVRRYGRMLPIVHSCGDLHIKVHVHFEHPNPVYTNRDAEYLCLPIAEMFLEQSQAVIVWEHGSDGRCVPAWKKFAEKYPGRFFVTLTAHHLASNEDVAFCDVRRKCKPPIKTEYDRETLVNLVSENHPWVMAGADDAAHDVHKKHVHEGKCACGAFTSPFLHQLYAHALKHLLRTKEGLRTYNNFTSHNARRLHRLPPSTRRMRLVEKPFKIPSLYEIGTWKVEPYGAGETLDFCLEK